MESAGVNLIPNTTITRTVELARRAEALGFRRCWMYDIGPAGVDVHVAMSAIASATERIHVGPGITNPYTRHPAVTASAIASLHELSGGRAFLGVGAGGEENLDMLGLERLEPVAAVRDTITVARKAFAGGPVHHLGPTTKVVDIEIESGPCDIEIWLAGRGPKMLALSGELCDGVMLDFFYRPQLHEVIDSIRRAGASHGRRPKICVSTMVVTDDESLIACKTNVSYTLADAPRSVREALGLTTADCDRIRWALTQGHDAIEECVRDEWVEPFVIAGSIDECADQLAQMSDELGVDEFLLPLLDDANAENVMGVVAEVLGLESR